MEVSFTLEDLAAKLREVAAERPDYVYVNDRDAPCRCVYWHESEGAPGCIFGHALQRLGVDVSSIISAGIRLVLNGWDVPGDYGPFVAVQNAQDGGAGVGRLPWGECVKALDEAYPVGP